MAFVRKCLLGKGAGDANVFVFAKARRGRKFEKPYCASATLQRAENTDIFVGRSHNGYEKD